MKAMEHHNMTDTNTSIAIIGVTLLLKLLSIITANQIIIGLTIVSLLFTIIYHAFGIYERYKNFKKSKNKKDE